MTSILFIENDNGDEWVAELNVNDKRSERPQGLNTWIERKIKGYYSDEPTRVTFYYVHSNNEQANHMESTWYRPQQLQYTVPSNTAMLENASLSTKGDVFTFKVRFIDHVCGVPLKGLDNRLQRETITKIEPPSKNAFEDLNESLSIELGYNTEDITNHVLYQWDNTTCGVVTYQLETEKHMIVADLSATNKWIHVQVIGPKLCKIIDYCEPNDYYEQNFTRRFAYEVEIDAQSSSVKKIT